MSAGRRGLVKKQQLVSKTFALTHLQKPWHLLIALLSAIAKRVTVVIHPCPSVRRLPIKLVFLETIRHINDNFVKRHLPPIKSVVDVWRLCFSFLALVDSVIRAHGMGVFVLRPLSVVRRLHFESVLQLSQNLLNVFRFQVALRLNQGVNWHLFFWFCLWLFHFFVNIKPYGSKNFQTLLPPQITFESVQYFSEFSSQWSSQKYFFGFFEKLWVYDFHDLFFVFVNMGPYENQNFTNALLWRPWSHSLLVFTSTLGPTSWCVCVSGGVWVFVRRLSRGFGSSNWRPHCVFSLIISGSGVPGLPQSSLPRSHPTESPAARAFYISGLGLLWVSDSSRPSRLSRSP